MKRAHVYASAVAIGMALWLAFQAPTSAGQQAAEGVRIDADDIGGVVTSAKGPEEGVWVIAETADLPTKFAKIVVTGDRGRYLLPDLPKANYSVWVRGYGLVDSPKVTAAPGRQVNVTATPAPDAAAAAQYYPAIYWYSMLQIPSADHFGSAGSIPANVKPTDWLDRMKSN